MGNKTKNSLLALGLVSFLTAIMLLGSCGSATDKSKDAKSSDAAENLIEATENLDEAEKEYAEKYEAFKVESDSKISENEKNIATLKSELKSKSNAVKADFEQKLTVLEAKNEAMKAKIRDYKNQGDENWEAFKVEFEHDMNNLGEALKDLTKNNTK